MISGTEELYLCDEGERREWYVPTPIETHFVKVSLNLDPQYKEDKISRVMASLYGIRGMDKTNAVNWMVRHMSNSDIATACTVMPSAIWLSSNRDIYYQLEGKMALLEGGKEFWTSVEEATTKGGR